MEVHYLHCPTRPWTPTKHICPSPPHHCRCCYPRRCSSQCRLGHSYCCYCCYQTHQDVLVLVPLHPPPSLFEGALALVPYLPGLGLQQRQLRQTRSLKQQLACSWRKCAGDSACECADGAFVPVCTLEHVHFSLTCLSECVRAYACVGVDT